MDTCFRAESLLFFVAREHRGNGTISSCRSPDRSSCIRVKVAIFARWSRRASQSSRAVEDLPGRRSMSIPTANYGGSSTTKFPSFLSTGARLSNITWMSGSFCAGSRARSYFPEPFARRAPKPKITMKNNRNAPAGRARFSGIFFSIAAISPTTKSKIQKVTNRVAMSAA